MKHRAKRNSSWAINGGLTALVAGALMVAFSTTPAWSATSPSLGAASTASVVAGTTVTNTGPTTLSGDLDLFPGTSVTGFPPGTVGGTVNTGTLNATAASNAMIAETAAYGVLAGAPVTGTANTDLSGLSFAPGVYAASSGLSLTGTVTLVGDANSVFIFKSVSTLITGPGSRVVLSGGVSPCNVWWQIGSSATFGTTTAFVGNVLALTSISLATGVTLQGRAMSQTGGVTLDSNVIDSSCSATPPVTTTSSTTSTTSTTTTAPVTTTTTSTGPVTTTTAPPLVAPPATGGGPLSPSTTGSNWSFLGFLAMVLGGGLLSFEGIRRIRARRS
jgi:hypothetical protein